MEQKGQGACDIDHQPFKEQEALGPWAKRPGFEAIPDPPGSLDIFRFLICKSGEGNRTVLVGLLRPFSLLGLLGLRI